MTAKVTLQPEQLSLLPGQTADVEVTIQNATAVVEHFAVTLVGLPGEYEFECEPAVVKLRPKESGTVRMRIGLPQQHGPVAGTYILGVLVRSPFQHGVSRCEELPLEIQPAPDLAMEVQPALVNGRSTAKYSMSLRNDGNSPLDVQLSGTDSEHDVRLMFDPTHVDLPPGATAYAQVSAKAKRPMTGQEKQRSLTVSATAGQLSTDRPVVFVQKPVIKGSVLRVAGISGGIAAMAGAMIGGALLVRGALGDDEADNAANETSTSQQATNGKPTPTEPEPTAEPTDPNGNGGGGGGNGQNPDGAVLADFSNPPDGQPGDRIIPGDLYADQGITLAGDTEFGSANCTAVALRKVTEEFPFGGFLTASHAADATKCNAMPVRIDFAKPASFVRVNFMGVDDVEYKLIVKFSDGSAKTLQKKTTNGELATLSFQADAGVTIASAVFGPTQPGEVPHFTVLKAVAHVPAS